MLLTQGGRPGGLGAPPWPDDSIEFLYITLLYIEFLYIAFALPVDCAWERMKVT